MSIWERPSFEWCYGAALFKERFGLKVAIYIQRDNTFCVYLNGHDYLSKIGHYNFKDGHDQDRIASDIASALERIRE